MDAKSLKDIAMVAIDDGEKVGAVSDILFDIDRRRIKALVVGTGSWLGGSHRVVDMDDVQSIGTDAIMIQHRNLLGGERDEGRYQSYPSLGTLTSLRVVTQSGDYVGPLATVDIDPATGAITDIEISHGGLTGVFKSNVVVPASSVISIGRDVAIIPDQVARERPDEQDGADEHTTTEAPLS